MIVTRDDDDANKEENFNGALTAIRDVTNGLEELVRQVQTVQYKLRGWDKEQERHTDENSVNSARAVLDQAFAKIKEPVKVVFKDQVCTVPCIVNALLYNYSVEQPRKNPKMGVPVPYFLTQRHPPTINPLPKYQQKPRKANEDHNC